MSSCQHSEPEEISQSPDSPATALPDRHKSDRTSRTMGSAPRSTAPITDFWTLLDALLDSGEKVKRFVILLAFILITTAVAGGLALGVLLLAIPEARLDSNWILPTLGAGGAANLLLLRRPRGNRDPRPPNRRRAPKRRKP